MQLPLPMPHPLHLQWLRTGKWVVTNVSDSKFEIAYAKGAQVG